MKENKGRTGCVLRINPDIYPLRVVYSCAYVFLDKAYIFLDGDPRKEILIRIKAKNGKGAHTIAEEFLNELLSASLRYQISRENKKLRERIVGAALISVSRAPLQPLDKSASHSPDRLNRHAAMNWGHVKNIRNYGQRQTKEEKIEDPLGIAIPWEEKHGKDHTASQLQPAPVQRRCDKKKHR